jgi:flagellar biosynthetic protein FliQ
MNVDTAVEVTRQAFWTAFVVGTPILMVGFIAGIVVSLIQILTSMQDPAFNTVPRLFVFLGAILLLLPWMTDRLLVYTSELLGGLDRFAR